MPMLLQQHLSTLLLHQNVCRLLLHQHVYTLLPYQGAVQQVVTPQLKHVF